ncbi:MAG: ABC transporter permease [Anaerolineae bacterium]|nr:ABC transporter permease [Anaerolineae bacterium]
MRNLWNNIRQISRYPSAIIGLTIIGLFVVFGIYTVVTLPYSEAIRLWRGGEDVWGENPKTARPIWYNLFSRYKLPPTIVLDSLKGEAVKTTEPLMEDGQDITLVYTFDYQYDDFPQELAVFFQTTYDEKSPYASLMWHTPDGREIRLGRLSLRPTETYRPALDDRLARRLGDVPPQIALFADPESETPTPLKGTYELEIRVTTFEPDADVEAKWVAYGQVHGLAGTDHRRRDLMVALEWGTPIALAFGLLAALGTTLTTMLVAAVGVWFGGWVDAIVQRITEINMVLPVLPILIMVGTFYSRSIWIMLGGVIALSIFGGSIKTFRAIFLQVREAPYIEAARAYGASNGRIIVRYLVPRIIPVMIPSLVSGVPVYVFLEASLTLLGLGDPVLPTWGKVIEDARAQGALHNGQYYWVLQPAALLMVVGLSFAMVGFSLDRVFNPRLRGL